MPEDGFFCTLAKECLEPAVAGEFVLPGILTSKRGLSGSPPPPWAPRHRSH